MDLNAIRAAGSVDAILPDGVLVLKVYRTPHYTSRSVWDGTRLVKIGHARELHDTAATVYDFAASRASGFAIPLEVPTTSHT